MRRPIVRLLVALAIPLVVTIRLSRSEIRRSEPPPPDLWETARPSGKPAASPVVTRSARGLTVSYPGLSTNCSTIVSTNQNSQYGLTSVEDGVQFDIDADGDLDQVAWTEAGSDVAFLAIDQDGDGRIADGRELIGNHTISGITSALDVLIELSSSSGMPSRLDRDNPVFAKIRLWRDTNHNGVSDAGELSRADNELSTIGLGYQPHRRIDSHGNQSRVRGFVHVRTAPGKNQATTPVEDRIRRRYMYEVCLVSR
jgi:hypothetical protein